jgi:hypothetical protein
LPGYLKVILVLGLTGAAVGVASTPTEAAFLAETARAMERITASMHTQPSGDVDRDFVAMMSACSDGFRGCRPLAGFVTNAAGAQIVNAIGPTRQIVSAHASVPRR